MFSLFFGGSLHKPQDVNCFMLNETGWGNGDEIKSPHSHDTYCTYHILIYYSRARGH